MNIVYENNNVILKNVCDFSLMDTLNCGQCFRFLLQEDGSFEGVVQNRFLKISSFNEDIILHNVTPEEFELFWKNYFDLDRDYSKIKKILLKDDTMKKASEYAPGIRVLRQDPWEALCSFIISQNNNVKRIMGIVERLCETFGEKLECGRYSFPTPERLAKLTPDDLAPLRCGFRAKYIIDAAQKVSSKEVDFSLIDQMNIEEAITYLTKIKGVGPKVAECALLYGLSRLDAFPKDVWINRAIDKYYQNGIPDFVLLYGGIAQQYLFHYIRTSEAS